MLVFNPDYTRQSPLFPSFVAKLNDICERDYGERLFQDTLLCLDLDKYEKSLTGDNDATIDAATGIANYMNNHISSPRHLLVELRLGYKSTRNFDLGNMKRKVTHSRDILKPQNVNDRIVFLFDNQVAPKARNYFSRLSKQDSIIKKWDAMGISDFNNYVVNRETLPYQAENDLEAISNDLRKTYESNGFDALDMRVGYWIERMEQYKLCYKHAESNSIANTILGFIQGIILNHESFEEKYLLLRIEEIKTFLQR